MNNKGQVGGIQDFVMAIVGISVVLAVGLIVLAELNTSQVTDVAGCGLNATGGAANPIYTGCGAAYNSTGSIITKLATVPTWIGILITVALAFIVLSFFAGRR